MKLFCVLVVAVLSSGFPTCGQSSSSGTEPKKSSVSQFVVGPGEVVMPQGFFLLIRNGRKIGGIRFTSIEQGSKLGTGKAIYESYFQGDGSGSFRSQNVIRKTGAINLKPLKGFHPFDFQFGNGKVKVGEWSFASIYPGSLNMWPYGGDEKDYGYEFAPTSAQSVEEIDTSDKHLKWFRYDADTKVVLPVSELPK